MKARTDAGMSPVQAVAFDLDGTLVDSAPDIAVALNTALSSEGLRRSELADVRGWIGDGPDALIERALAAKGQPGDDAAWQRHWPMAWCFPASANSCAACTSACRWWS
jgi:phosphoglycolate phosphatase-like HAD superfamily hydrolase